MQAEHMQAHAPPMCLCGDDTGPRVFMMPGGGGVVCLWTLAHEARPQARARHRAEVCVWVCSATSWSMHPAVQVGGCPATLPRNSRACRCPLPFYTLGPPSPWACMLGSTHWLGQHLQATYKLRVVQTRIGWAVCAATIALLLFSCPSMAVVLAVGLVSFFDIDCSVSSMNCFNLLRVTPSPPPPRGGSVIAVAAATALVASTPPPTCGCLHRQTQMSQWIAHSLLARGVLRLSLVPPISYVPP